MSKLYCMYTEYAGQVPAELRPANHSPARQPLTPEQIAQRDSERERAAKLASLFGTVKAPTTFNSVCTCKRDDLGLLVKCDACQLKTSTITNKSK